MPIWKQHILKTGLPKALKAWLAQGKDRQTLRGLILYGWQAQFHQQVNAAKSFNEGAPNYKHLKIYADARELAKSGEHFPYCTHS